MGSEFVLKNELNEKPIENNIDLALKGGDIIKNKGDYHYCTFSEIKNGEAYNLIFNDIPNGLMNKKQSNSLINYLKENYNNDNEFIIPQNTEMKVIRYKDNIVTLKLDDKIRFEILDEFLTYHAEECENDLFNCIMLIRKKVE
jgi:hypothetical protein